MEESQGETEKAHFPEQMRKHSESNGAHQSIHAGMAELFQYCGYEKQHGSTKQMVVPKNTDVHMEAMETAENAKAETIESWTD